MYFLYTFPISLSEGTRSLIICFTKTGGSTQKEQKDHKLCFFLLGGGGGLGGDEVICSAIKWERAVKPISLGFTAQVKLFKLDNY